MKMYFKHKSKYTISKSGLMQSYKVIKMIQTTVNGLLIV